MKDNRQAWSNDTLATPHDAPDKAQRVQDMFNGIAPKYQFVNSLFSAGRDAAWRRKAAELARVHEQDEVLDIACGTGDFGRAFAQRGAASVVACDFAHEMLVRAAEIPDASPRLRPRWCEADATHLPFRSESFSITTCAFGVRNFQDLEAGLSEMARVLRVGGRAVILEFTRPRNRAVRWFYEVYASRVMPLAATLITGDKTGASRYLPRSVVSFLDTDQMSATLKRCGFSSVEVTSLSFGVVAVYIATRA